MRVLKKFYIAAASLAVAVGAIVALNATGTTSQAVSSFRNCNADAIIRCGAITEAELLQKYDQNVGDVQNVYKHYGITRSDLAGTASQIKHGTVYRDGRVVVDGKTVATGAYSVSRIRYTSAGTPRNVVINGTTYYEGPSMQIFTGAVDAYVYMRDGQFHKAVLSSCGNPLIATPPPKPPVYTCDNLVATKIDRTRFKFTSTASAANGAEIVRYSYNFGDGITTSRTSTNIVEHTYAQPGTYTVTLSVDARVNGVIKTVTGPNCKVTIKVEEAPAYKCESLTATKLERNKFRFDAIASAKNGAQIVSYNYDFGDGKKLTNDESTEHTYSAPGTYTITVTVNVTVDGKTIVVSGPNCKATIVVDEAPTYKCESLTATKLSRTNYRFATTATASNGAEIVSYNYDFGDGSKTTTGATVDHNYASPGTYIITSTVNVKVDGKVVVVAGANCKATIVVDEAPVYVCDSLTASKINRTTYRFNAAATASNGAEIIGYTYNFGDNNSTISTSAQVDHTYASAGTYTATLTVNFKVDGQTKSVTGPGCKVTIKVDEAPAYKCESLTASKISRTNFRFTTVAFASNGAEIVSYNYDFGDGSKTTTGATVDHNYAAPGSYTANVTVNVKVDGKTIVVSGPNCKVTIKVDEAPAYKCESLTASKINRTTYQFTAAATASNGAEIVSYTYNFGDSKTTTSADTQVNHTYAEAGTYTATLTVNFKVNGEVKTATGPNCKVTIVVEEAPAYKCESLTATKISRTSFRFTTVASASNGAEIVSYTYNFGDGNSQTGGSTIEHTYDRPGNYAVMVALNIRINGQVLPPSTDPKCKTTVTVEEEPVTPVYKCESLTAQLIQSKERTYAYTLQYTAEGGATLTKVTYDFGDSASETFTAPNATSVEHQYAAPGDYTTTATLYFNVKEGENTVEKSATCKVTITIARLDNCPLPGKEHLPKDSPECKEDVENCPIPGKEHLPKNSTECVEDVENCPIPGKEHLPKNSTECVETPPELPRTGFDMFLGGGLGLGSISAAGYYWSASRRNLMNTLLNR